MYSPVNPSVTVKKVGFKWAKIMFSHDFACFRDECFVNLTLCSPMGVLCSRDCGPYWAFPYLCYYVYSVFVRMLFCDVVSCHSNNNRIKLMTNQIFKLINGRDISWMCPTSFVRELSVIE